MTMYASKDDVITFDHRIADTSGEGYYEGQLLIATPSMSEGLFSQSVIYLMAHNQGGAMGLMINKTMETVDYEHIYKHLELPYNDDHLEFPMFYGGPVEENRGFILHSDDYQTDDTLLQASGVCVTSSARVFRDILTGSGPGHFQICAGYAGWGTGQLEREIEANCWITAPACTSLLFHADNLDKYSLSAKMLGVDMTRFSPFAGHA